jgi:hypothetical protein
MKHLNCKLYYQQLHLKYLCNLAWYSLSAPWGWHYSVETCRSVIICEMIVHIFVTVHNNKKYIWCLWSTGESLLDSLWERKRTTSFTWSRRLWVSPSSLFKGNLPLRLTWRWPETVSLRACWVAVNNTWSHTAAHLSFFMTVFRNQSEEL